MTSIASPGPGAHVEHPRATANGFLMLALGIALLLGALVQTLWLIGPGRVSLAAIGLALLLLVLGVLALAGLFTLQPREAAILQLFGAYRGTNRAPGLRWTNPFYSRRKVSLRARNLNGDRLKVNDKRGNPIEIAAVVVWRVDDTAKAVFDVDAYETF